ncbi:hypothetical protein [Litorihabitans aurantiacus]|uniref:hypothetical protein n=1 Tax=Litorihabitans aurantiacus TaxID=1930061 RepID=UPI0024E15F06|nr:hypothetical protein [Litorihabitans aurantiacus]
MLYDGPDGVHPVVGTFDAEHRARGGGGGSLGYPLGPVSMRGAGNQCQSFERGHLVRLSDQWIVSPHGSWFLAPALAELRTQINQAFPGRDKTTDGTVGDLAHQARVSDHNPDRTACGVVRAFDIDKDLRTGDPQVLAEALTKDPRVAYVIFRSRIYLRTAGAWRPYTGSNPHDSHIHVSLRHGVAYDHAVGSWALS